MNVILWHMGFLFDSLQHEVDYKGILSVGLVLMSIDYIICKIKMWEF